jgi:hypothetical protein
MTSNNAIINGWATVPSPSENRGGQCLHPVLPSRNMHPQNLPVVRGEDCKLPDVPNIAMAHGTEGVAWPRKRPNRPVPIPEAVKEAESAIRTALSPKTVMVQKWYRQYLVKTAWSYVQIEAVDSPMNEKGHILRRCCKTRRNWQRVLCF